MNTLNMVMSANDSTVVAEYKPIDAKSDAYQSEADLENEFIRILTSMKYEYLKINSEDDLINNLRLQLEKLNKFQFTDSEWKRFFTKYIANSNDDIAAKTKKIQESDSVQAFTKDNGETQNIKLIDKKNIHNNFLQVINQYEENNGNYENRYDVTILVNGLPLVHVELKRRGVAIREAFNQIKRYQRDSFWASSGLYQYVQIFIISNGTHTKYYSNTTRESHIKEMNSQRNKTRKTSNSFKFTSYWADAKNKTIPDLIDFAKTFLAKHTILSILTKYCVFTADEILLVMRPYQIAACEKIITKIEIANNYKLMGTINAGGYVWHTTGSGKTLTSFKTAQIASNLEYIDKVLFVVDRKDLDYQTMKEYDKFQKGAANSNKSTTVLEKQLRDDNCKIIITTIQKLGVFIQKYKNHDIFTKHVVMIFDECHRSQFGELHQLIIKAFKNYHLFGFTGTPIFSQNSVSGGNPKLKTTPQVFGGEPDENGKEVRPLHTYTIVNAINDGNVLPFRIDYINTIKEKSGIADRKVRDIDSENAMNSPERIKNNVTYILEHFNQKTKRNDKSYVFNKLTNITDVVNSTEKNKVEEIKQKIRMSGFNSILAVTSIPVCKMYYEELKNQIKNQNRNDLVVATIFSFSANEEDPDDSNFDVESFDTDRLDKSSRDFLEEAIKDYNERL